MKQYEWKNAIVQLSRSPRTRGWDEGQVGDSVEVTKNHILYTSNNIGGFLLHFGYL
jgi:hypothetical protein